MKLPTIRPHADTGLRSARSECLHLQARIWIFGSGIHSDKSECVTQEKNGNKQTTIPKERKKNPQSTLSQSSIYTSTFWGKKKSLKNLLLIIETLGCRHFLLC